MATFCIHIRESKTILSFIDEHYCSDGEAPLAYKPIEVWVYKGYSFTGKIRDGFIHCSSWKYKVKFGKLVVACRIDDV